MTTELLIAGTRLYSSDNGKTLFLDEPEGKVEEYVVLHDTRLSYVPVQIAQGRVFKAYQPNEHVSAVIPDEYIAATGIFFGRKVFVMHERAYYISSGRSNAHCENNFPGVVFPFKGVNGLGWFIKCYGCEENDVWIQRLLERFPHTMVCFLRRFETFEQLKVSALIGGGGNFWDANRPLRRFVLQHEWNVEEEEFCKVKMTWKQRPLWKPQFRGNNWEVNVWLQENGAKLE